MNDKRKELHELIDNMLDEFEQAIMNSMELASKETARCIMEMLQEAVESQNEMICKNNCINVVWLAGKISSKYGMDSMNFTKPTEAQAQSFWGQRNKKL